eukprot:scaffold3374_cov17-Tisochrysis_lutea.AAC.1
MFWDDTDDGSNIGVDVGEISLGMLQHGGTYMPSFAVVEATKKQVERGRHGGGSVILWYLWPSLLLGCCASCNASSAKCYPAHLTLPDVRKSHFNMECCKGYRKGLQEGL